VLGPNGAGKSTLIKALGGTLPLWGGRRIVGDGAKIAYFSQDLAQDLPLDMSPLEYVEMKAREADPNVTMEKCRQAVGALGLRDSIALTKIGVLSGGEKARAALAVFALVPCNVLLLDEASNHLDAATIKTLTGALQDFAGAIVAITHNPMFAASLNATHILRVSGGTAVLTDKVGELSDADFEHAVAPPPPRESKAKAKVGGPSGKQKGKARDTAASAAAAPPPSKAAAAPAKPKRTTLAWAEKKEYEKLQKDMPAVEALRDRLQAEVTRLAAGGDSDFKRMEAAAVDLAEAQGRLDKMEVRWLELAELAGDL